MNPIFAEKPEAGIGVASETDAVGLFDTLWEYFRDRYALFTPKRIDWNALYRVYRPRLHALTTDAELFDLCAALLGHLNDNHVRLKNGARIFRSGLLGGEGGREDNFSRELIRKKYLRENGEEALNGTFTYGWADAGVGYLHFDKFANPVQSLEIFKGILETFQNTKGLVLDVRANRGGDDLLGKWMAECFADRRRTYMVTRTKRGPASGDFSAPRAWTLAPAAGLRFEKPVILLIDRHSVSAAENFALALRTLPQVTVVGDTTSGCFSDAYWDTLPNGWEFSISYKLFTDQNGFCWEGIGVPPDLRQTNAAEDIRAGRDRILEFAIDLIEAGQPAVRFDAKTISEYETSSPHIEDLLVLACRACLEGRAGEALNLLKTGQSDFPDHWQMDYWQGRCYLLLGDEEAATRAFQKSLKLNPKFFPWERQMNIQVSEWLAGPRKNSGAWQWADLPPWCLV